MVKQQTYPRRHNYSTFSPEENKTLKKKPYYDKIKNKSKPTKEK